MVGGSGGVDAALLAIRGHRFSQRGDKFLRQARSAKQSCQDKTHRGYVVEVSNRRTPRPTELGKKISCRRVESVDGSYKRWHAVGLLSVTFNSLSKPEDVVVHSTAKRATRRRKLAGVARDADTSSRKRTADGPQRGESRVNEVTRTMAKERHASPFTHCTRPLWHGIYDFYDCRQACTSPT